MARRFFVSDTHFNHANIIKFCKRPFKNVREMNEILIRNWNALISSEDIVYHLGDLGGGDLRQILNRLNGQIVYIPSQEWTHERGVLKCKDRFVKIVPLLTIRENDIYVTMCHYCLRTWPKSQYNSWDLYGHSHGRLEPIGKQWDVGVDNNYYKPLSFEQIVQIMIKRPDNPNLVKKEKK